jgi:hypothetical protein
VCISRPKFHYTWANMASLYHNTSTTFSHILLKFVLNIFRQLLILYHRRTQQLYVYHAYQIWFITCHIITFIITKWKFIVTSNMIRSVNNKCSVFWFTTQSYNPVQVKGSIGCCYRASWASRVISYNLSFGLDIRYPHFNIDTTYWELKGAFVNWCAIFLPSFLFLCH